MPDTPLRPATPAEVADALAYALRFDGRRRVRDAEPAMARIAAERLVEHLQLAGFIILKRPPSPAPSAPPVEPGR
jgi:hypothetical protein